MYTHTHTFTHTHTHTHTQICIHTDRARLKACVSDGASGAGLPCIGPASVISVSEITATTLPATLPVSA